MLTVKLLLGRHHINSGSYGQTSANYSTTTSEDTDIVSSLDSKSFTTDTCYTLLITYLRYIGVYVVADV